MPKMTIHLNQTATLFLIQGNGPATQAFKEGRFLQLPPMDCHATGEEAAEEAFDLTNNPSRQDERMARYGNGRSVSSGDVVESCGKYYMCLSFGWEEISK